MIEITGEIPTEVELNSVLSIVRSRKKEIHSIGGHPARFIPEIPRWALRNFSKPGDVVLDPFCGSGTTLIEARKLGCSVIGIDNNPVARLISSVKTRNINTKKAKKHLEVVLNHVKSQIGQEVELPYVTNRDFWFDLPVSHSLMKLRNSITTIQDKEIRDLLLLCFSDIIRTVSHVAPGQILQARRPNNHKQKELSESDVINTFEQKCRSVFKLLHDDFSAITSTQIIGSMEELSDFDLIITSPPYINAVDYVWAYKLRMHWLGMANSSKERLDLSSTEIGTERIAKSDYFENFESGIDELDCKLNEIEQGVNYRAGKGQNELRAQVTYKYFQQMEEHLKFMSQRMKTGSKYCLVIGDSNICKTYIPTSDYLIKYAEKNNMKKTHHFFVLLKNRTLNISRDLEWADKIDYEQIVVFERL